MNESCRDKHLHGLYISAQLWLTMCSRYEPPTPPVVMLVFQNRMACTRPVL